MKTFSVGVQRRQLPGGGNWASVVTATRYRIKVASDIGYCKWTGVSHYVQTEPFVAAILRPPVAVSPAAPYCDTCRG